MERRSDPIQREYPSAPLVGVGALIVDQDRIVLIRRGNPPSRGEWSIPGGLVAVGESLRHAVVREALEETALVVRSVTLVDVVERIFPDEHGRVRYHYVLADYLCSVVGGTLRAGSDALDARWASQDNLDDYGLPSLTAEIVGKAFALARDPDLEKGSPHRD